MKLFKAEIKLPNGHKFTFIAESEEDCAANDLRNIAAYFCKCHVGMIRKPEAFRTTKTILKNPECMVIKNVKNAWVI